MLYERVVFLQLFFSLYYVYLVDLFVKILYNIDINNDERLKIYAVKCT